MAKVTHSDKKLIKYEKYKGVSLSKKGKDIAINILMPKRYLVRLFESSISFLLPAPSLMTR